MLKKDLIELCLLHLLAQEDQYGYDLLKKLHTAFPDTQESAVYALLRGLCKAGCSEQYVGETSDGPARKYYRLIMLLLPLSGRSGNPCVPLRPIFFEFHITVSPPLRIY